MRTFTALALLAAASSGRDACAAPDDDSWVPIVVLRGEAAVPLRPGANPGEVVLGFVQVSDLEDGLPLSIGWQRVDHAAIDAVQPRRQRQVALGSAGGIKFDAHTTLSEPGVTCSAQLTPVDAGQCLQLLPSQRSLGVEASYQLGTALWSLGVEQSRMAADPLAWLRASDWRTVPAAGAGNFQIRDSVSLGSRFRTGYGTFGLDLQLAQSDLPQLLGDQLNQGRFSISWLHGNLGGALNTRVQRLDNSSSDFWGGIDLGLIWRTPWNGLLSIGARNLVTGGRPPAALDPDVAPLSDSEERIPYVRYEQDL